jgi:hypothetical protein
MHRHPRILRRFADELRDAREMMAKPILGKIFDKRAVLLVAAHPDEPAVADEYLGWFIPEDKLPKCLISHIGQQPIVNDNLD